jgi:hypothetical protein
MSIVLEVELRLYIQAIVLLVVVRTGEREGKVQKTGGYCGAPMRRTGLNERLFLTVWAGIGRLVVRVLLCLR